MRLPDLAAVPVLRLARYAFEQVFGEPSATVWQAPGGLVLLGDGDASLSVAMRWGAIVAARPRRDDVIVVASMNSPGERIEMPLAALTDGRGHDPGHPAWAAAAIRAAAALQGGTAAALQGGTAAALQGGTAAAQAGAAGLPQAGAAATHRVKGASLLIHDDLPESSSLASPAAVATASLLALADVSGLDLAPAAAAPLLPVSGIAGATPLLARQATALLATAGGAFAGSVPFDLDAAGLRLLLADSAAPPGSRLRPGPDTALRAGSGPRHNGAGPGPDGDRDPAVDAAPRTTPERDEPAAGPGATYVRAAADCLREHGPAAIGPFLTEGPAGRRQRTGQPGRGARPDAVPDAVVRAAVAGGALGAGATEDRPGLLVALVPIPALPAVRQVVARAFMDQGWRRPHILSTVAAHGADRAA